MSSAAGAGATARRLLAGALRIEPADLPVAAAIGQTERWDSLAHLNLILALEEHLGVRLDTDTMLAIESLDDIEALLRAGVAAAAPTDSGA